MIQIDHLRRSSDHIIGLCSTNSRPTVPFLGTINYVWRNAFPGDHVCVTGDVRDQAARDNAAAASRRDPVCRRQHPQVNATLAARELIAFASAMPKIEETLVIGNAPPDKHPATAAVGSLTSSSVRFRTPKEQGQLAPPPNVRGADCSNEPSCNAGVLRKTEGGGLA